MKSFTFAVTASLMALTNAQDRYQKVGNEVGAFYSSVGAVLADPNADAAGLSVAAQQADVAVASFKNEIRTMDWSDLGADAAKQQTANLELYISGLDNANAELHAIANKAAIEHANNNYNVAKDKLAQQPQQQYAQQQQAIPQQRAYLQNRINAVVTGLQNKAVVRDVSKTITSSSEPTEASSSLNSKEEKSESKESKKEEKSESKASKKEEKSESKESKKEEKSASKSEKSASSEATATATGVGAAGAKANNDTSVSTASPSSTKHSKNNAAMLATGISGSALFAAIFALI